ncbi:unnamed protein product [Litomosoides sigmodontis]|uniref:Uncharacterized protein n=1 Tax=Litomosoides sigmodontis TaxID=42156 RepID=A0A3P6SGK7_LITSI|nr:unnamed protein product [Litomosoides sigmodontis]
MDSREERIISYLNSHPKFLENYATGPNVTNEAFHRWCARRNMRMKKEALKDIGGPWMDDDLSDFYNLLIANASNVSLLLYELGHACAQLTHNEFFDVIMHSDNNTYLVSRTETNVRLKPVTKEKRLPVYAKKVGYSGVLLGEIHFYRSLTERDHTSVNILCTWGSALIYYAQLLSSRDDEACLWYNNEQRMLNTFLLDVVK